MALKFGLSPHQLRNDIKPLIESGWLKGTDINIPSNSRQALVNHNPRQKNDSGTKRNPCAINGTVKTVCGICGADGKEYKQAQNTRHGANLGACFTFLSISCIGLVCKFFSRARKSLAIFRFSC
jgi:hypothetical protein